MAVQLAHYRFTRDEYHRMVEAGILHEDSPVELIEGEILEMSPIGRRHKAAVDRLTEIFVPAVRGVAIVRVQSSIVLGERSEPEPDVVLLRPREDSTRAPMRLRRTCCSSSRLPITPRCTTARQRRRSTLGTASRSSGSPT